MNCPACSLEVAANSKFCPSCGNALGTAEEAVEVTEVEHPNPEPSSATPVAPNQQDQFDPGKMISGRYRIVSLLGRGGMGEVYRADDLQLGHAVALKFLPQRVSVDPVALERFKGEVRTARKVTHPNVCRIHDMGEDQGRAFLSMEYVDGEDLSQVIKRLGRPTKEKSLEITRQLCLSLAAAHDVGIVHRDLKPANIMIDGRGRVRIMDFGIAGLEKDLARESRVAGTPSHMAPELFRGQQASVQSDIYALGLVLYEIYTGKQAYAATELRELKAMHESATPTTPSSLVEDMDPVVERVILRCIEKDPEQRPTSVYSVLSSLPGGDPLAAAMAAGETPSPELVAHAGGTGGVQPRTALLCLIAVAVLFCVIAWSFSPHLTPIGDSPERLRIQAEAILNDLGYEGLPSYSAEGFSIRPAVLDSLRKDGHVPSKSELTRNNAFYFWVRWNPDPLVHESIHSAKPTLGSPKQGSPNSITIQLDTTGRLIGLQVYPDVLRKKGDEAQTAGFDWVPLVDAAELNSDPLSGDVVVREDRIYAFADESLIWRDPTNGSSTNAFVYHTGIRDGRLVHFSIENDLGKTAELWSFYGAPGSDHKMTPQDWFWLPLDVLPLLAAVFLTWKNIRANRGDKRGATVLAAMIFAGYMFESIFAVNLAESSLVEVIRNLANERAFGHALIHAIPIWFFYMAAEPYVRRLWPTMLVSWMRAASGKLRDPLVGRDILYGCVVGASATAVIGVGQMISAHLGWMLPQVTPDPKELRALMGASAMFLDASANVALAILDTGHILIISLLVHLIFRKYVITVTVAFLVAAGGIFLDLMGYFGIAGAAVMGLAFAIASVIPLFRFGLVSALTSGFVMRLLIAIPATFDLTAWYARLMLIGLAFLVALLGFSFATATAGRPIFKDLLSESS